jgi:hypothetical protein
MRQKLTIVITVALVIGVLLAINSAAYVREEERRDSELAPNRSTYHSGPTGTRALYDFLSESGYKVMRWRETPERLLGMSGQKVRTFVIVGSTPLSIEENQARTLLLWVEQGGRLVLVDRRPEIHLLPHSGHWTIATEFLSFPSLDIDPASAKEMTRNADPLHPVQPDLLTHNIDTVMPSRLAATTSFFAEKKEEQKEDGWQSGGGEEGQPPAAPITSRDSKPLIQDSATPISPAPVIHISGAKGALLLDYPHGQGRIVVLTDPYIFSNGGIALQDNLQLAINMLVANGGLIAFDEYHQGRGTTHNAFVSYFAGTPVLALAGQLLCLILVVLWTRGRRFGRPLPLAQVDRRSSLEFVASMAELQQRARALDLAIENIYSRSRRVLTRYAGMEYNSPRAQIAARVAARSSLDPRALEALMQQCEETINGGPISERQAIQLIKQLRQVEAGLGLRMRSREVKQSAQNI